MKMKNLKTLRQNKGLTQDNVAKLLNRSRVSYTNIENGNREPNLETINKLANIFNVSINELFEDIKQKPTQEKEITFDDFTYAMHNESKELTDEEKEQLLEMAKFFKFQLDNEKQNKKK